MRGRVRLIDSHAHVQADRFDRDRPGVLKATQDAGVERRLVPGWDVASSAASIALARETFVDPSVGVHPHFVASVDDTAWRDIESLARDRAVVAIGETGLDYDRALSPRDTQLASLRRHLKLAAELAKPVIVHCRSRPGERDAHDDLVRALGDAGGPLRPILHSFSGPADYAERALELGAAISFSGLVFRSGEEASVDVARLVPADRLLVETDSPYLSPPGAPKRRNEPRYVEVTARWLATVRGHDPEALGDMLVANYDLLFRRSP